MVNENDLNTIEQAHLAAERLEKANEELKALISKKEELEKREEGRRLLGGQSSAGGQQTPKELTPEDKLKIDTKNYWKGSALEGFFK